MGLMHVNALRLQSQYMLGRRAIATDSSVPSCCAASRRQWSLAVFWLKSWGFSSCAQP